MSPVYRIRHLTEYRYRAPVTGSYGLVHLLPADGPRQRTLAAELSVSPQPEQLREGVDFFGNRVARFVLHEPHTTLTVLARSEVAVEDRPAEGPLFGELPWEAVAPALAAGEGGWAVRQFLLDSPAVAVSAELRDYAAACFVPGAGLLEAAGGLVHAIYRDFTYAPGTTTVTTPLSTVVAERRGVCQDFAHLGIACLRAMGVPARYVSGYLETDPPPGQPKLVGVDGSHAWFEAWVPDAGWVGLDPTNDTIVSGRYVTTAIGRDYNDVPPMQGVIYTDAPTESLHVEVDVIATPGPGNEAS